MYILNTYPIEMKDDELRTSTEYVFEELETLTSFLEYVFTFGIAVGVEIRQDE